MENNFLLKREGDVLIVVLGDELNTTNAPALMEALGGYAGTGVETVVFDATALRYIASSGIRTIIFAKQKMGGNPAIVFRNCGEEIRSVFEMTGLQHYIAFESQP